MYVSKNNKLTIAFKDNLVFNSKIGGEDLIQFIKSINISNQPNKLFEKFEKIDKPELIKLLAGKDGLYPHSNL